MSKVIREARRQAHLSEIKGEGGLARVGVDRLAPNKVSHFLKLLDRIQAHHGSENAMLQALPMSWNTLDEIRKNKRLSVPVAKKILTHYNEKVGPNDHRP